MKTCYRCDFPKPIEDFYTHPGMADGRLGKCKECCIAEANARRAAKIVEIRAYDRARGSLPHRVEARRKYAENNPEPFRRAGKRWSLRNPDKRKAHSKFWKALMSGKVIRKFTCETCGSVHRVEAHHEDYTKPLEVRWLCKQHHVEADKIRRLGEAA